LRNQQKMTRVMSRMRLSESRPSASLGACWGNLAWGGPEIPIGEFLIEALVEC
jgi:hypothetical protein